MVQDIVKQRDVDRLWQLRVRRLAGDRLEREDPGALQVRAGAVAIEAAEQLIAAADGEQGGAAVERGADLLGAGGEVGGDERLLAVLAAADVEEVVLAGDEAVAEADRAHLELVAAPRRPPGEDRHVAAVGVDVQVVGIEVADDDLHAAASQ